MEEREIGVIDHYFNNIGVAIIKLSDSLKVGDKLHIKGHTADFLQDVTSMQIEHLVILEGKPGDLVGIKVSAKVHQYDKVYKVV